MSDKVIAKSNRERDRQTQRQSKKGEEWKQRAGKLLVILISQDIGVVCPTNQYQGCSFLFHDSMSNVFLAKNIFIIRHTMFVGDSSVLNSILI